MYPLGRCWCFFCLFLCCSVVAHIHQWLKRVYLLRVPVLIVSIVSDQGIFITALFMELPHKYILISASFVFGCVYIDKEIVIPPPSKNVFLVVRSQEHLNSIEEIFSFIKLPTWLTNYTHSSDSIEPWPWIVVWMDGWWVAIILIWLVHKLPVLAPSFTDSFIYIGRFN